MHQTRRATLFSSLLVVSALIGCADDTPSLALGPEGMLPVDGASLSYITEGSGASFVLLHGGPGIGQGYFLSELEMPGFPPPGLRWIAYDQRGSGRSTGVETPDRLTMDQFVEDLEAVRAASGQERVGLFGHAFGGLLAMHYAVRYPDRVAAMVLLDPDPAEQSLWAAHEDIVSARITDEDRMLLSAITSGENWEVDPAQLESFQLVRYRSFFGNRAVADRLRLGLPMSIYGNYPTTAVAVRESLGAWDLFPELSGVEARTLVVTGDQSIFPMEAHERLVGTLPNAELVILPGVGHFPHMEDPQGFTAAVNVFLSSITEDTPGGGS